MPAYTQEQRGYWMSAFARHHTKSSDALETVGFVK